MPNRLNLKTGLTSHNDITLVRSSQLVCFSTKGGCFRFSADPPDAGPAGATGLLLFSVELVAVEQIFILLAIDNDNFISFSFHGLANVLEIIPVGRFFHFHASNVLRNTQNNRSTVAGSLRFLPKQVRSLCL